MSIIKDLLSHKENFFCSAIRAYKLRAEKQKLAEYSYRGRLSVGDFAAAGTNCCPKKLVQNRQKGKQFGVATTYKLDLGKEIHRSYQQAAVETPGLMWDKPLNFPGDIMINSPDKEDASFAQKLAEGFPEIPVCMLDPDLEIAIIGYMDGVINRYKKPTVLELKSVNVDPIIFKNKFSDNYPDKKHILQSKIYIYLTRLWDYYDPPIKTAVIPYICVRGEIGDDGMENEVLISYTDEDESIIGKMLQEGVRQVFAFKHNLEYECEYIHCREHGLKEGKE